MRERRAEVHQVIGFSEDSEPVVGFRALVRTGLVVAAFSAICHRQALLSGPISRGKLTPRLQWISERPVLARCGHAGIPAIGSAVEREHAAPAAWSDGLQMTHMRH